MTKEFFESKKDYFYFVFRVIIGLVFLLHGLQKMSGMLDGKIALFSLFGAAGVIEVVGGILLIIGLFTRYVAIIAAIEMLVAYFKVHLSSGLNPLVNHGEPALLFFAAFLVLIVFSAGKISVENMMCH